jgi:hypothetical protein
MSDEIFESCVRSGGDLAGVFEHDGETGYFYLYNVGGDTGEKIVDAIRVVSGEVDFRGSDISVRWDEGEERVGLFIRGVLWAVFDPGRGLKHGEGYGPGAEPSLPGDLVEGFG